MLQAGWEGGKKVQVRRPAFVAETALPGIEAKVIRIAADSFLQGIAITSHAWSAACLCMSIFTITYAE